MRKQFALHTANPKVHGWRQIQMLWLDQRKWHNYLNGATLTQENIIMQKKNQSISSVFSQWVFVELWHLSEKVSRAQADVEAGLHDAAHAHLQSVWWKCLEKCWKWMRPARGAGCSEVAWEWGRIQRWRWSDCCRWWRQRRRGRERLPQSPGKVLQKVIRQSKPDEVQFEYIFQKWTRSCVMRQNMIGMEPDLGGECVGRWRGWGNHWNPCSVHILEKFIQMQRIVQLKHSSKEMAIRLVFYVD